MQSLLHLQFTCNNLSNVSKGTNKLNINHKIGYFMGSRVHTSINSRGPTNKKTVCICVPVI